MAEAVLEVSHLTITYPAGGRTIVDDLSFSVLAGEAVALVGESGSGKTTASLAIMGLPPDGLRKTAGSVRLLGEDITDLSQEGYRKLRNVKMGMVMQNPISCFDPVFSIWSHFKETLKSHQSVTKDEIREKAVLALSEAGFERPENVLELYPFQMSGGMLQRVMLAITLVLSPPLVIADEATTDLDVPSQAVILRLLNERRQERGLSLLIITHDLSVAAAMASKIVFLENGHLIEIGEAKTIFSNPASTGASKLLALHRDLYTDRYMKVTKNLTQI
ncbi:MAG: ABC transporter ATP-binding protein [Deltaproteobacteria bacterium]|jgi:nickel transport system ATP-binding protein|nr:ABC transporter ATP-binding protein [Deltaproteobacteria bacterium]